jgi:hypothetical protein
MIGKVLATHSVRVNPLHAVCVAEHHGLMKPYTVPRGPYNGNLYTPYQGAQTQNKVPNIKIQL